MQRFALPLKMFRRFPPVPQDGECQGEQGKYGCRLRDASLGVARRRVSVVEDRQIELAEARGVGEYVNCDDSSILDCEAPDRERLSVTRRDEPRGAVDERR